MTLPQYLTAAGSIAAVHNVTISPEVEGRVTKIAFEAGSATKKGDLLVQLNDAPERAERAAMRAQERLAQVALDRARRLLASGFVAQAQLDRAQSQHDAAAANVAKVEAAIAQKQIRAPFDGKLGVRWIEVGQYLTAGAAVTTLTETAPLYINFAMPEQAVPRLAVGQDVDLDVAAYPGRKFPARVAIIDPQVMSDTRTVRVQAISDNTDGVLTPGMYAKVQVSLAARDNVLTIPETAVNHSLYGDSVYLIQESKGEKGEAVLTVTRTPIQTGERVDNRVAVTGIKEGDRVVTTGQIRLFEGAVVTLSNRSLLKPPADFTAN
jgi:multidrug efflux system membrane fusion protein